MICECTEFANDLLNLIKELLETECEKSQWTAFEKFLNQQPLENKREFTDFSSRRTMPSYEYQCISSNLNSRIEKYKSSGLGAPVLLLDIVSSVYLTGHFFRNRLLCELDLHILLMMSFPSSGETLRVFAAFHDHTDFMKLLVKYGYLSSLPKDSPHLRKEMSALIFHFIKSVRSTGDTYSILERVMDLLKSFFRYNEDGDFYRRMFLVGKALHAVRHSLEKNYKAAEDSINCIRMYFSATKDLYLTAYDVRSVLYGIFIILNQSHLFEKYSEEFEKLMPECPATQQPRKPTHLARCQIRQNLKRSNLSLPAAIEKLHLPQRLKNFVLCNVFDFPSNYGNISVKNVITKAELARLFFGRPSC